ncbi:hypothetical protein [Erythrobacter sp.]|uniref:hypothetical protein n=1 Tax=Erythrobacter sp. TaxID=1042 RepID=UPI00311FF330
MRPTIIPAALLSLIAIPVAAQEAPAPAPEAGALADMAQQMQDPERQRDLALVAQTMAEVLLDLPIAPLAQAAAEMAGEEARQIAPDLTLRKLAPEAGELSGEIGRSAPRVMQAAGTLAGALAAMAPTLREMAEQMARALPRKD